ncbi:MAG TPA: sugar transferase [Thermoanaerobaculia bacterium]|nr:sugar transferase [Thermoanaerobaculia bacterium]
MKPPGAPAVRPGLPRAVDIAAALAGLAVATPVVALAAAAIVLTTGDPPFFRQRRIGRYGRPFTLVKLRTMRRSTSGAAVTSRGDARVTRVGAVLRRTKVDELPQLWNVLRGEMAFVGPRPEVPRYVDPSHPLWVRVLAARPGLTDPVTLRLRNEEELLEGAPGDREAFYRAHLQPWKLRGYAAYLERRNWRTDARVLLETALAVARPAKARPPSIDDILAEGLQTCGDAR